MSVLESGDAIVNFKNLREKWCGIQIEFNHHSTDKYFLIHVNKNFYHSSTKYL